MNVATVFKQSTTTSARMSSNIHHQRTELSALSSSIRFDPNLNRKNGKVNGLVTFQDKKEQSSFLSSSPLNHHPSNSTSTSTSSTSTFKSSAVQRKPIKSTTILMESNAILNVVQRPAEHHHHQHQRPPQNYRRHSMSVQEERLLKILKAAPDEPLYMTNTSSATATATTATGATTATANNRSINDNNKCTADNLLMQYEAATSSITTTSADNYENENRPPPSTVDKNTVAANNIEDGNNLDTMSSTPQKGFSVAAWNKIQRDLNSPSASCRIRAIRAINSPANGTYYSNFDAVDATENGHHNETDAEIECSIEKPKTIQEVMKDVIVYVEYRSDTENRTIGIKDYIAKLGAKVNDRLLRNTTHVVFKDGLQSTYNKAKSWNIPIVSILWIDACKKHLILMNPNAFKIPDIQKYENPDLYEKTKRHKYLQPDTLMKNLHRPIPKSKILEELKKTNESHGNTTTAASSSQSLLSQSTIPCSPNISQRTFTQRKALATTAAAGGASIKSSQSRKSLSKKVDEKPKNTIRSMFAKQLEKSQHEQSQINGTIDQITTLHLNDGNGSTVTSNKESEKTNDSVQTGENGKNALATTTNQSQEILVNGSLHKRLTRRNSMTLRTPTKSITTTQSDDMVPATPSSIKKRRCTMFSPSLKLSIEEEISGSNDNTKATTTSTSSSSLSSSTSTTSTLTPANKTVLAVADKTVNKSIAMDVCNQSKARDIRNTSTVTQSNSKVRQLLNDDLSKGSHESSLSSSSSSSSTSTTMTSMFLQPKVRLPRIRLPLQTRRTTFTLQPMDETKVLQSNSNSNISTNSSSTSTSTPVSLTKRRNTMNINTRPTTTSTATTKTPQSKVVAELNKSNSCDAILTPTNNKFNDMNPVLSSTPSFQSLSRAHRDHIRNSTSKSLLDEYNNTFSSTKTPITDKRRTLSHIALDIIKQRVENINRNASFNRSMHDLHDDSANTGYDDLNKITPEQLDTVPAKATATASAAVAAMSTPPTAIGVMESGTTNVTPALKPLKRKLFAPPSLFPEHSPIGLVTTPQKTDTKKTANQKRKRNDLCAVKSVIPPASASLSKSDEKKKPTEKPRNNSRKTLAHSRRSTMFFETPPSAAATAAQKPSSTVSSTSTLSTNPTAMAEIRKLSAISTPSLVFTSMHQPQIDFITETVKKLGKFKLDDKVNSSTTHLVAFDGRRTVNILRALIRGIWILDYDWILNSMVANQWLPELEYEMHEFSKAVEINRIERQAFGSSYKMDLFRNFDTFFVSSKCACKQLKELVKLCHGKITQNERQARYIICEYHQMHIDNQKSIQLHPNWILDSISAGKIQKFSKYILKPNE